VSDYPRIPSPPLSHTAPTAAPQRKKRGVCGSRKRHSREALAMTSSDAQFYIACMTSVNPKCSPGHTSLIEHGLCFRRGPVASLSRKVMTRAMARKISRDGVVRAGLVGVESCWDLRYLPWASSTVSEDCRLRHWIGTPSMVSTSFDITRWISKD